MSKTKEIHLTQGKVAIVDTKDYEWLMQWKWCAVKDRGMYYAVRAVYVKHGQKTQHIYMHRAILQTPIGMHSDHKNHDGLDNRRSNLRCCTYAQNQHNQKPCQRKTSSQYKGVRFHAKAGKWQARIFHKAKSHSLGCFFSEVDAANAYNIAAMDYFGDFACLNVVGGRQ